MIRYIFPPVITACIIGVAAAGFSDPGGKAFLAAWLCLCGVALGVLINIVWRDID